MEHTEFAIGVDFSCGGKRWRCTDIGSRTVIAISLEPHEVVSVGIDPNDRSIRTEFRYLTDDPIWLEGPPFGIVEHVFDEESQAECVP